MTGSSDRFAFKGKVAELGKARSKAPDEDQVDGLYKLLADLPLDAVLAGLEHSARHDRWFPDPVKIRAAAAMQRHHGRQASVSPETAAALAAGEVWCASCDDTGWAMVDLAGRVLTSVEAAGTATHQMRARACGCRPDNALYQARVARQPRMVAQGES